MIIPGKLDLRGGRWVPFVYTIEVRGLNLADASLQAQIRLYENAPGAPLADLPNVTTASVQGVQLVSVSTAADDVPVSIVRLRVNETVMEAMPGAANFEDPDAVFAWDLQVNPAGGLKYVLLRGSFTVEGGVTQ